MKFKQKLIKLGACEEAIRWVGDRTMEEAFRDCPRADWILWAHEKFFPEKKRERVLAAAHCANTVRHLMQDDRSKKAVDTAIRYGEGKATEEELQFAADAAAEAADYAAAAFSFFTADYAAAAAAYAAAADAAAYAADAAVDGSADYITLKERYLQKTADICRKYLEFEKITK
jgi:hypothetical protein